MTLRRQQLKKTKVINNNNTKSKTVFFLLSRYGKVRRGYRTFGNNKKIYFDSMAEANYYRILSFLKKAGEIKDFKYHPKSFDFSQWIKYGIRRYEIDFKIIERNGDEKYVEIKSTSDLKKMDSNSRTRINRLKKYYPDVNFRVTTTSDVRAIGNKLPIPGWEK